MMEKKEKLTWLAEKFNLANGGKHVMWNSTKRLDKKQGKLL